MCPKKRLSGVKLLNPPGMERTLQSTRRMGYLQSGIDVEEKIQFRVESHIFADKEFESK